MNFSKTQMQKSRKADLFQFLTVNHPDSFTREGIGERQCLRKRDNHSISIKYGYSGYTDFGTGETGNSVDFLVRHMGYTLPEAVLALSEGYEIHPTNVSISSNIIEEPLKITLPEPVAGQYKQLFAYLQQRRIPADLIQLLIDQGLLYQADDHNNIIFVNAERDCVEVHGSLSYGPSYHRCIKNVADRYWSFSSAPNPKVAYICEAAIDAISLYLIHRSEGNNTPACYISTIGCANQQAIDRIKQSGFKRVVLAVDNDTAGMITRRRNSDIEHIIPIHKDWNEDWAARG